MQVNHMIIGYDAKRAFHNDTGLGNFSRTLISNMSHLYPEHQYLLFNPKTSSKYHFESDNIREVLPTKFFHKAFPSIWRSYGITKESKNLKIDLYHGLSHEIPFGIHRSGIRTIVTIHDLIFLRYPEQYNPIDVHIYTQKFRYACKYADHIITISKQTKNDIIHFFGTQPEKITVCQICCDPIFFNKVDAAEKQLVRSQLRLPEKYFLYVGSIIERKNILTLCKALLLIKQDIDIPLVVIGRGRKYKEEVKQFAAQEGLLNNIIFLSDDPLAQNYSDFKSGKCFPAIYQSAMALIYPSLFEGFGIPVLEGMWSGIPVITSNISSMPEVGGEGVYYVDPLDVEEIAAGMINIAADKEWASELGMKGFREAQKFSPEICTSSVMDVYKAIC